jgi:hypothetical protein
MGPNLLLEENFELFQHGLTLANKYNKLARRNGEKLSLHENSKNGHPERAFY